MTARLTFLEKRALRNAGSHILTEATWFHHWSTEATPASWTLMAWSLEYQLRSQARFHLLTEATALLLRSSLVVETVLSELVGAFGVAGVTSHWSGRHGTFDFSAFDVSPDRSNLVLSMVCVKSDGSLDFDGLEFGV